MNSKTFWRLSGDPVTWDFGAFLPSVKTLGADHVHFQYSGHISLSKFGGQENPREIAEGRFEHVLKPLALLADCTYDVGPEEIEGLRAGWSLGDLSRTFQKEGWIWKYRPKKDPGKRNYVTVTLRNSFRHINKNSNRPVWDRVMNEIGKEKEVVLLDECEGKPIPVEERMNLYGHADMNLGTTNGPMILLYASECPYLVFRIIPPNDEIWRQHHWDTGFPVGSQLPFRTKRQKIVWELDDYEIIMKHYLKAMCEH